MKIKLEFDLTPKEFRDSLGMPDVAGLQTKAVKALQDKIASGVKDVNVTALVEGWMTQGLATSKQLQGLFSSAVGSMMDAKDIHKPGSKDD